MRKRLCSSDRGGRVHGGNAEGLETGTLAGVDEVVLVGEAKDSAVNAPLVEELTGIGVLVEDVGSTCIDSQLLQSYSVIGEILTLQNVDTLSTEVILVRGTVVDIPCIIDPLDLRCPYCPELVHLASNHGIVRVTYHCNNERQYCLARRLWSHQS